MIYLLEDDDSIRKLIIYGLESQKYPTEGFETPSAFGAAMKKELPELIILDIMLSEEDGLTILKKLRASHTTKDIPVILLTAKNSEYDRVIGLDSGADDFISKPFGMMELVARVRAVLRRTNQKEPAKSYQIGGLFVSPGQHVVRSDGRDVNLTNKEFDILCLLLENTGLVLSRDVLMERIWGYDAERENRTLDVHIRTLRSKLGKAGNLIETVRGVGYKIEEET